jgi:hypothetical protein
MRSQGTFAGGTSSGISVEIPTRGPTGNPSFDGVATTMTRDEFWRLVERNVLKLVNHDEGTGVATATSRRGVTVTLRPDLHDLPVQQT